MSAESAAASAASAASAAASAASASAASATSASVTPAPSETADAVRRAADDAAARGLPVEFLARDGSGRPSEGDYGDLPIVKSVVVQRGDSFVFVVTPLDAQFSWARLRAHLGVKRLKLPDADAAFAATGYRRGTITPLGATTAWPVILDESLAGGPMLIGAGSHGVGARVHADDLVSAYGAEVVALTDSPNSRRTNMTPTPTQQTIAIIGGHGQIALLATARLAAAGHRVLSVVRNPDHEADIEGAGGEPVLVDIERTTAEQLAGAIGAADTLLFAAGAGPGSGPARKEIVDHQGALTTMAAARLLGARVVQISYIGVANTPPESAGPDFLAYQRAKYAADLALEASGLDWTIVRPGTLTDAAGTGRVAVGDALERGPVSRENVAALLAEVLASKGLGGASFDVLDGGTEIAEAVGGLAVK